jgi:antitoxin (DNA-binding transcriptional repressor) of toxin-antitoxin stability system
MYNGAVAKNVIHISDAEAASSRSWTAGAEIVIEHDGRPVTVVRPARPHVRLRSESLRLVREHGSTATLDADFAEDVEAAIEMRHRLPGRFASTRVGIAEHEI